MDLLKAKAALLRQENRRDPGTFTDRMRAQIPLPVLEPTLPRATAAIAITAKLDRFS